MNIIYRVLGWLLCVPAFALAQPVIKQDDCFDFYLKKHHEAVKGNNIRGALDKLDAAELCPNISSQQKKQLDDLKNKTKTTFDSVLADGKKNILVMRAVTKALEEEQNDPTLALQFAHAACEFSDNTNQTAVDIRRRILRNTSNIYRLNSTPFFYSRFKMNPSGTHQLVYANGGGEVGLSQIEPKRDTMLGVIGNAWDLIEYDWDSSMNRIATVDRNSYVQLFNVTTQQTFAWRANETAGTECVAADLSADGQWLLIGYKNNKQGLLELWDLRGDTPVMYWNNVTRDVVTCVNFTGRKNNVFTVGYEGFTSNLIEIDAFKRGLLLRYYSLLGHTGKVTAVTSSSDDRWIATASDDGTAIIWDANKGHKIAQVEVTKGAIEQLLFAPDNRHIFTRTKESVVQCWDLNGELIQTYRETSTAQIIEDMAVWMDTKERSLHLVTVRTNYSSTNFSAPFWLEHWEPLYPDEHDNTGHTASITALAVSPDGRWVVSCARDQLVKCWEVATGKVNWTYHSGSQVNTVAWRGNMIALGLSNGEIRQLDTDGICFKTLRSQEGAIQALDLEHNAKSILFASYGNTSVMVNLNGDHITSVQHKAEPTAVAFGHVRSKWATVDQKGVLHISPEKNNRKQLKEKILLDTTLLDVCWSASDLYLVVTGLKGFAAIVSPEGKVLRHLAHPADVAVTSAAFLSDQWVITGDDKGVLRLFDALTAKEPAVEYLPNGALNAIVAHSDGRTFFVADERGKIWRLHREGSRFAFGKLYIGHGGYTDWATIVDDESSNAVILPSNTYGQTLQNSAQINRTFSNAMVITGSSNSRNIRFWNRDKIEQKRLNMAPVEAPIHYFAHLGGGKPIFGGSMERVIRWDTFADHAAQIVGYHTSPLLAIKASSKYVASVDQENKVKIWDEQGVAIDSFQLPGLFNAFCWVDSTQLTLAVDTNSTNSVLLSWKFGTDTLLPVAYRTQKHIYNIQKHPSKNLFALLESNQFASLINGEGKLIKQYNTLYSTDISMTEDALWTWSGSQLQAWDISDNPQAVYPLYEYTLPNYEPVMAVGSIQNRIMVCGLKSGPVYLPDHLKALKNNEIASLSPDMRAKFGLFPPVEEYIISNNIAELSDGIEIYYEMAGIATDTAEKILLSKQALQLCQRYSEFELLPLEYQQYVAAIHDEAMRSWINEQAVQYASDIQVFSLLAASLVSDTTLALDIHTALWNNSWALILAGAYSAGADMAKRAIDMNLPEPRRYTTITNQLMGQVLSGELTLTQAEAAYCQWMKVPWREDERFEYFGEIFQLDIDELRESGHLSPADKEKLDYMEAFLKAEKCK